MIQLEVLKVFKSNPNELSVLEKLAALDNKFTEKLENLKRDIDTSLSKNQTIPPLFAFPPPSCEPTTPKSFTSTIPPSATNITEQRYSSQSASTQTPPTPSPPPPSPSAATRPTAHVPASTPVQATEPLPPRQARKCALPTTVCLDFCTRHGCPSRSAKTVSDKLTPKPHFRTEKVKNVKMKRPLKAAKTKIYENSSFSHPLTSRPDPDLGQYLSTTKIFNNKRFIIISPTLSVKTNPHNTTCPTNNEFISEIVAEVVETVLHTCDAPTKDVQPDISVISIDDPIITAIFGDPHDDDGKFTTDIQPSLN